MNIDSQDAELDNEMREKRLHTEDRGELLWHESINPSHYSSLMKKQEDDLFLFQFGITHRHKDDDARMVVDYDRDNASDADSTGSERKRREKEAKIDEEEFSGDEEDYQEVSVSLFCEE